MSSHHQESSLTVTPLLLAQLLVTDSPTRLRGKLLGKLREEAANALSQKS